MENKSIFVLVAAMLGLGLYGCASTNVNVKPQTAADELMEKSQDKKPDWVYRIPEGKEGSLFFVGLSEKKATEKEARSEALEDAISKVVKYFGTLAQEKYQKITTSYGLSSEVVDPTNATRNFTEHLASAVVSKVKEQEVYLEKWKTRLNETYYVIYMLAKVGKGGLEDASKQAADQTISDLKKQRDATNEAKAKSQFDNAMKAFEEMKNQGFGE